jgi:hypothetical protein
LSTIRPELSAVRKWPLCVGSVRVARKRIAATLQDVSDQWVLIVERQLIREQRKHIRLTYCMQTGQVLAGQLERHLSKHQTVKSTRRHPIPNQPDACRLDDVVDAPCWSPIVYFGHSRTPSKRTESQNYASVDIMFCDAINLGGGWQPQIHRSSLRAACLPSGAVII